MDRRQVLAALSGGVLGFEGMHAIGMPEFNGSPQEKEPVAVCGNHRMLRYDHYDRMLVGDVKLSEELWDRSQEITLRVHSALNLKNYPHGAENYRNPFSIFRLQHIVYELARLGDWFGEILAEPGKPPVRYIGLGAETVYRIETTKGRLLEFQQSTIGPDYAAIARCPVEKCDESETNRRWNWTGPLPAPVIRFRPEQILHLRTRYRNEEERKLHYPYGVSTLYTGKLRLDAEFENDMIEGIRQLVKRFS